MKEIYLHKNKGIVLVDDEDYEYLNKFIWNISSMGYAQKIPTKENNFYLMHRLIMNPPRDKYIDHIDGNPLNNQKINLRIVTPQQNQENMKLSKRNTSGYRGVSYSKITNTWKAYANHKNKEHRAGFYKTAKEAGLAAENLRQKLGFLTNTLNPEPILNPPENKRKINKNNKCGHLYVYYVKSRNKYVYQLNLQNGKFKAKYFDSLNEAIEGFEKAKKEYGIE